MVPMTSAGPFVRLRRLSGQRRRALIRAAWMLTAASAAVAVMPFRRAIRLGCVRLGRGSVSPEDCVWAVEAAARRLPWRTMCIEKGLAVQRMLRAVGVAAILHYGARHHRDTGRLEAHVWVTVDGHTVIGGEDAGGFREIATFP